MPLKFIAGISRKLGLPGYSSVGASCQVEVELASNPLVDLDAFREEAHLIYQACTQAVDGELAAYRSGGPADAGVACGAAASFGSVCEDADGPAGGNGRDNGRGNTNGRRNGNGRGNGRGRGERRAEESAGFRAPARVRPPARQPDPGTG